MHTLSLPFTILTYFGIWKPTKWTCKWKKNLYNLFSITVISIQYTFVASELIEVIVYFIKHKDISDTLFILLTTASAAYKAIAFIFLRVDMVNLGNMLLKDFCVPKNKDEKMIQKKYDNINRNITAITLLMVYGNIMSMLAIPLFQTADERSLPFKTWLPYTLKKKINYRLSFFHQFLGLLACASISVANDNIVTGFMMQACAQFSILEHRLKILPKIIEISKTKMTDREVDIREKILLISSINHHIHIFDYINEVIRTFSSVILVQFCASSTVITISVYQLSIKNPGDMDFFMVFIYLLSMLTEFFMYCWFGNEVTLTSVQFAKNVYTTDWTTLRVSSWKMISFMVHRASKPIFVSCYNFIILSLETYVQILKISYSAFNVLIKSSE